MANTYSQSYFHLVFSPKNRAALIEKSWKDDLEKYITGIIQNQNHKLMAIYAMPDHIHILISYNLNQLIPNLVEHIKTSSNEWIKHNKLSRFKFDWQRGYGAFTCSHSQVSRVATYIENQEAHHNRKSFKKEYLKILKEYDIEYKDQYLFDFFD